jgi:hypothetical protein
VALLGVVLLAVVGAVFLAGAAWHAITSRTPSVNIQVTEPRDFVEYLRGRGRD